MIAPMQTNTQVSLVTGGAGFVGRALVEALVARGDRVIVVEPHGESFRDDIQYERVDIRDTEALARVCEGVTSVFHNASLVHTKHNREDDVWSVNLGGARSVLRACWQARVKKLVYVSTASAVYEGKDIERGDESLPYSRKSQAPYADSKIAAEREILAANGQRGVLTCAIRPHVVFGPGDRRFLPAVVGKAKAGKLRLSVGLYNRKLSDFTYVDNLIDALLLADERLSADGRWPVRRTSSPMASRCRSSTSSRACCASWGCPKLWAPCPTPSPTRRRPSRRASIPCAAARSTRKRACRASPCATWCATTTSISARPAASSATRRASVSTRRFA